MLRHDRPGGDFLITRNDLLVLTAKVSIVTGGCSRGGSNNRLALQSLVGRAPLLELARGVLALSALDDSVVLGLGCGGIACQTVQGGINVAANGFTDALESCQ